MDLLRRAPALSALLCLPFLLSQAACSDDDDDGTPVEPTPTATAPGTPTPTAPASPTPTPVESPTPSVSPTPTPSAPVTPTPTPTPTPAGDLGITDAFTADGTTLEVVFERDLDPATVVAAAFSVTIGDGSAGPEVSEVVHDGASVTLTLASELTGGGPYTLMTVDLLDTDGVGLDPVERDAVITGELHFALIWHQHQPIYEDAENNYLRGPWVRKHGTKSYYDMTAMVADYPDIHMMVNLTPTMLRQLEEFYIGRIGPYVNRETRTVDEAGYFAQKMDAESPWPVSDPWIDLLLADTPDPADLTELQEGWFYGDNWTTFSVSEVVIARFPAYLALKEKVDSAPETLTQDDLLQMKGWFQLAWFDPDFLRGPVQMPSGDIVDLSDLITELGDGSFELAGPFTEDICNRLVAEELVVLDNVVAIHSTLAYDAVEKTGQVEVMTTPFAHPILPLLVDTELALEQMPTSSQPSMPFQYPEDATVHVARAKRAFADRFGQEMTGMWPAEGSVAEAVVPIFQAEGVRWIASDRKTLERSTPNDSPIYSPYRVDADTTVGDDDASDAMAIVFRDTELSDKIGFAYQAGVPEENVEDFMENVLKHAGPYGEPRLLSVILDGENAWEWYTQDNDAKAFLNGMYAALTEAQEQGRLRTVTVSEYLDGNEARGVEPHPVAELPELEPLAAGSWISGNYAIWIGEDEENLAWDYLRATRDDLADFEAAGLTRPGLDEETPEEGTADWYRWQAWENMYAAEGSDWFWWYGSDQTAVGGDEPFDRLFRALLEGVYRNAQLAGIDTEVPSFPPILRVCEAPSGNMTGVPTIDGVFDPDNAEDPGQPNEWTSRGSGVCVDQDGGPGSSGVDDLGVYYHGLRGVGLFLALRSNDSLQEKLGTDYEVRVYLSQKRLDENAEPIDAERDPHLATTRAGDAIPFLGEGAAREISISFAGEAPVARVATVGEGAWGAPAPDEAIELGVGEDVIEMQIPNASMNYLQDDPLEMLITSFEGGVELDRAPNVNSIVVVADRSTLVEVTIIVDATGRDVALDAVKPIANPPPPLGTGTVFIVGNEAEFGNWTPNTVPMADDGETFGDVTAGDNLWTFTLVVPPLTDLQYKFTIGSAGEGWGPTEEYPLTNRGLTVNDANGDGKMIIRDVFADRPNPSGAIAGRSEILNP